MNPETCSITQHCKATRSSWSLTLRLDSAKFSQPRLRASFHFLVDQLTRFDFPQALDLHLGRARFPFCIFNNSTNRRPPRPHPPRVCLFLPVASVAVLTVPQRHDSFHIITRHGPSRIHRSHLITLPLTLTLVRRILCIPAYFPLNLVRWFCQPPQPGTLRLSVLRTPVCTSLLQRSGLSRVRETPGTSLYLQPASLRLPLCHLPPTGLSTCPPFGSISPIVVRHSRAITDIILRKCTALLWDPDSKKIKRRRTCA